MESAITVKGQATIPKSIREHLGLHPGDRVKFFVHPDGSVVRLAVHHNPMQCDRRSSAGRRHFGT
ncbi:MAG: type II toxin-antitoxin system PrlF family antitoxin [Acidobacteriia bacterium]|nr:type II toxin-antitoxin system PrlF family antitoxin [Terriglobia bacterium]